MKILLPCCGSSSRYPNMPPKWMLPDSDGVPMIFRCLEKLDYDLSDVIVTVLEEHEKKYEIRNALSKIFKHDINVVVLKEKTKSQSETVYKTIEAAKIDESIFIKDSDNSFMLDNLNQDVNYVSVASLNDFDFINPRNKSYVQLDDESIISSIHEKKVVSDSFSVGGYFFRDSSYFMSVYERLSNDPALNEKEIYISEVISYMLTDGESFISRSVKEYSDWGTVHEWRRTIESKKLFLISVDGFLFERGSEYFSPLFKDVKANIRAIECIQELSARGHSFIYLSIRPETYFNETKKALDSKNVPEGRLLMECDVSQWTVVSSPHPALPLLTSRAREVNPEDENLIEKLLSLY